MTGNCNTGMIVGKHVCEYTGEIVISRKRTMKDAAAEMDRDAIERMASDSSITEIKLSCAES